MQLKIFYGILLLTLLLTSCNTTKNATITPKKDDYTFLIELQKQQPIDALMRASSIILNPTDFEMYAEGLRLHYDSIEDSQLAAIKAEIVKCSGILKMKIIKE